MERNLKRRKKTSSFHLKQQFISLLSSELKNSGFDVVLDFESSFRSRICTLRFGNDRKVEVCVNLDYVKKSVNAAGCSMIFKVSYCALFIAEYIKQIGYARSGVPQSYFEGLVFLNAIEICKEKKTAGIYSPLFRWDKPPKSGYCVRPIEISSAINALNRVRMIAPSRLSKQDKAAIRSFGDSLLLYSGLPEIAYVHASIPVYALVDSLKRQANIIVKDPEAVQEFPILALAPFAQIKQLTAGDLFLSCIRSDNSFLIGAAIRLIAFLHLPYDLGIDDIHLEKLVSAMNAYIDYSIVYYNELSKCGGRLMNDNLFAISDVVKSINGYLSMHGFGVIAGGIHTTV